jgi:hypothetical protein
MAPRIARNPKSRQRRLFEAEPNRVSLPAAALFSFLKDTRGITTWSTRDFAETLNLSTADAKEALAILKMQGYVKARPAARDLRTDPPLGSGNQDPAEASHPWESTVTIPRFRMVIGRPVGEGEALSFTVIFGRNVVLEHFVRNDF